MKKILALIIILTIIFTQTASAEIYYSDITNHWNRSDINYATNVIKVFNGYSDYKFKPDNNISRSEFIVILTRTGMKLGLINEVYNSSINYSDFNINHWSYTYIASFYEYMKNNFKRYSFEEIFAGNRFSPDRAITREEAIALISVMCKCSIYDNNISFSDLSFNHKYYDEIKTLCNNGILKGYTDNTLKLANKITRAESASLIRRIFDDVKMQHMDFKDIKYMPISGEDILSFFGEYDLNTKDDMEKRYIKAKNTLEQLDFYGYIFPEEKHLFDSNPIKTLKDLKKENFPNKIGVDFYLLKYGKMSTAENINASEEILSEIKKSKVLKDSDMMQIFKEVKKYNVSEELYMSALQKWYNATSNDSVKFNIKMLRYEYYLKIGNKAIVRQMINEDLKAGTDFSKILNINWNIDTSKKIDLMDFSSIKLYYSVIDRTAFIYSIHNPSNKHISVLDKVVIIENDLPVSVAGIKNEVLYYKWALNKAYILKNIDGNDRSFIEAINDFEIVRAMSMYKTRKADIDSTFVSILKYFKCN